METVNKKLTSEQLEALNKAGVLALNPDDEFLYTPEVYRKNPEIFPKEMWPVFKLKYLDGISAAKNSDNTGHMEVSEDRTQKWVSTNSKTRLEVLKTHILRWKRFTDANGNEIPFRHNNGTLNNECLKAMRVGLQIELMNVITEGSTMTEEEILGLEF